MDQPTVLYICDDLGAEAPGNEWERALARMLPRVEAGRFRPVVVGLGPKPLSSVFAETPAVPVSHLGRSRIDPATVTAVLKVLGQIRPHVVHLHGPSAATYGRLAGGFRKLPMVLQADDGQNSGHGRLARATAGLLARWTDVALASSESAASVAVQAWSVPAVRVKVVDTDENSADLLVARLERLYRLLSRTPRTGRRPAVAPEDLAFLEERSER
jgi:hypothetical protein